MKNELSIEQSAHLIDLGVDPKLASKEVALTVYEREYNDPRHPVFTLDDVIEALPQKLGGYNLCIKGVKNGYEVSYLRFDTFTSQWAYLCDRIVTPELIDALYRLLCWVANDVLYKSKIKKK